MLIICVAYDDIILSLAQSDNIDVISYVGGSESLSIWFDSMRFQHEFPSKIKQDHLPNTFDFTPSHGLPP